MLLGLGFQAQGDKTGNESVRAAVTKKGREDIPITGGTHSCDTSHK